jgi:hypothetical protein
VAIGAGSRRVDWIICTLDLSLGLQCVRQIASCSEAFKWLQIQADLGLSSRTAEAYARAMTDYLNFCQSDGIEPLTAARLEIAHYVLGAGRRGVGQEATTRLAEAFGSPVIPVQLSPA